MKKQTKIILLVALALCLVFTAVACDKKSDVFDAKNYEEPASYVYTSATKIDGLTDWNYGGSQANLAHFSKTIDGVLNQKVYNLATKSFVGTFTNVLAAENVTAKTYTILLRSVDLDNVDKDVAYFMVKEVATTSGSDPVTTYTYTLYDASGSQKDQMVKKYNININTLDNGSCFDMIVFNNKIYRIDDNAAITLVKEGNDLSNGMPNLNDKAGDYYYAMPAGGIVFYGADLSTKYSYTIPALAQETAIFYLGDDSFLVQYLVKKFDIDSDYDFIRLDAMVQVKYDIHQQVIDVKKGKVKDVDLGYYIDACFEKTGNKEAFNGLKSKITAYVYALEIKDKMLANDVDRKIFAIGKDGKLGTQLNATIDGETMFVILAKNKVMLMDKTNRMFLYDFSGKLIGEIDGNNIEDFTDKYIVTANSIYDFDLQKYDYVENDYFIVNSFGSNLVLYNDDTETAYIYGTEKTFKLSTVDGVTTEMEEMGEDYAIISVTNTEGTKYTVYNTNGIAITGLVDTVYQVDFANTDYMGVAIAYAEIDGHVEYFVIA